jgi:hypothetical protein
MIRLNCQTNARVCRSERVMAFPTMRLYKRDQPVWPEYSGDRTTEGILKWLLETVAHPILQEHHTFENFTDRGCRVKGQIEAPRVMLLFFLILDSQRKRGDTFREYLICFKEPIFILLNKFTFLSFYIYSQDFFYPGYLVERGFCFPLKISK